MGDAKDRTVVIEHLQSGYDSAQLAVTLAFGKLKNLLTLRRYREKVQVKRYYGVCSGLIGDPNTSTVLIGGGGSIVTLGR